jgi:hypothetical protein
MEFLVVLGPDRGHVGAGQGGGPLRPHYQHLADHQLRHTAGQYLSEHGWIAGHCVGFVV